MWWSVGIEVTGEQPAAIAPDELERFALALVPWSAAVTGSPEEGAARYGARLSLEADGPESALANALATFRSAAAKAGLPAWPIAEASCMTEDELEHQMARPAFPELVGVSEIARLLGDGGAAPVSRQRASAITARDDFPDPVARLASGPVWTRDSVRNFVDTWDRRPGRPARQ